MQCGCFFHQSEATAELPVPILFVPEPDHAFWVVMLKQEPCGSFVMMMRDKRCKHRNDSFYPRIFLTLRRCVEVAFQEFGWAVDPLRVDACLATAVVMDERGYVPLATKTYPRRERPCILPPTVEDQSPLCQETSVLPHVMPPRKRRAIDRPPPPPPSPPSPPPALDAMVTSSSSYTLVLPDDADDRAYIERIVALPWDSELVNTLLEYSVFPRLLLPHKCKRREGKEVFVNCRFLHPDGTTVVDDVWVPLKILKHCYPEQTSEMHY